MQIKMAKAQITKDIFTQIKWNADGLISAIAQDCENGEVLMLAWMNEEALTKTITTGDVWYYSRSRQKLWRKGEESGNCQKLIEMFLDCDGDCLLIKIAQTGPACHTGRKSCFYKKLINNNWEISAPIIKEIK